jgi:Holliday junction resolvasome RuvABC endonuclease subunit
MKVLAFDMSFANVGVAVFKDDKLVDHFCIVNSKLGGKKEDELVRRTLFLTKEVHRTIKNYKADRYIVELATGCRSQSASSGNKLGIAFGIVNSAIVSSGRNPIFITPTDGKLALTGSARAEKGDMMSEAVRLYPELAKHKRGGLEHISDAVGVYLAYKQMRPLKEATGEW